MAKTFTRYTLEVLQTYRNTRRLLGFWGVAMMVWGASPIVLGHPTSLYFAEGAMYAFFGGCILWNLFWDPIQRVSASIPVSSVWRDIRDSEDPRHTVAREILDSRDNTVFMLSLILGLSFINSGLTILILSLRAGETPTTVAPLTQPGYRLQEHEEGGCHD